MSRFLGIDLGTQSLKAVVYDAEKREEIAVGGSALRLLSRADGAREQLAEWWVQALHSTLQQIPPDCRASVQALAVSGQQHGFVPLGADGRVLAPVKLWCDTSTVGECGEIAAAFGGQQQCIEEVGNAILPGYTAPKIAWLKKNHPERYAELDTILLPHDYLNHYLTGETFMECGDASGTGLLDIRTRDWHPGMLAAVDPDRDLADCLPRLIGAGDAGGRLRAPAAELLGLPAGIPVACGGGDNMMAAIGTGNLTEGRLTMSLGTSGTLFAYAEAPCIDPAGELAAFCSSTGGWLPLLCTMNCTVATEQARALFGMELGALEEAVSAAAPGAGGVVVLPFYNGERVPNLPRGKGCILGLDGSNATAANIARASMESAVFGLRAGLEAFERTRGALVEKISEIRLTGGAARSAVWRQIVADNFGWPVRVPDTEEGAAMGAALNAMLLGNAGHGDSRALAAAVDEHVKFDETAGAVPQPRAAAVYRQRYETYRGYVDRLGPLFA